MNAVHPITYHVVKVEQEHRLARLERQRDEMTHPAPGAATPSRVMFAMPRRLAIASASALLAASLIAGAALALQQPAGSAPMGGPNSGAASHGGGGVYLLR